jgi:cell division protein FtsQ
VVKAAGPDRRPPAPDVSPGPPPSRLRAAVALAPLAAGLLLLAAAIVLGWLALQALQGQERYQIAFDDIDCAPPPGVTREDFLDDVRYYAKLPDKACVLDDGLPARLSAAFAKHPWVERVEGVEVAGPRQVRVRLVYRTAVLRVQAPDPADKWVVDANGIRLPSEAADEKLPLLVGDVRPPGQQGRPWGDDRVLAAARTAALLGPHQDRLRLNIIEISTDGLVLRGEGRLVKWGAAAGEAEEAKLQRLLDYAARQGDGEWKPLDLRDVGERGASAP